MLVDDADTLLKVLLIHVARGDDLAVFERQKRSRVPHAHVAAANDAERDTLRGRGDVFTPERPRGNDGRRNDGCAGEREELSAVEGAGRGRSFHDAPAG